MAINKNFVIKNGVEVNTNLLVGDSTLNMVGVGTTIPGYDLHVGRGAGGRGGIGATDLTVTGIATIGVANSTSGALSVTGISTFEGEILGQGGITARTAKVTDLTSTRLVIAGTGGELEDNANLTFGSGVFTVADNVSIGGSINVSGIATAQSLSIGATAVIDRNFQLKNIASLDSTTTTTIENAIASGPNIFDDLEVTGLSTFVGLGTFESGVWVAGIGTFENNLVVSGLTTLTTLAVSGVSTFASVGSNLIPDADGSRNIGAAGSEWQDLYIDGTANIDALSADTAIIGDLTDNRVVIVGSGGELEDDGNLTFDGAMLKVGTAATIAVNGNAAFAGIVTVGGNLNVTGDIVYDEVTGRNLNISGVATVATLAVTGIGTAETLQIGNLGLGVTGISTFRSRVDFGEVGTSATVFANGNATFSGIVTAAQFEGGGIGIGIGSTGSGTLGLDLVGFGYTMLSFVGSGVSMVRYNDTLGIATIVIEGGSGGSAGAAGTWSAYSSSGIATTKAIGVGTVGMAVTALQGGEKGASSGIGASFRGAYISNGMVVFDNELNDSHYIGTAFNGLMAGPVTVNGTMTVDGNWAVV